MSALRETDRVEINSGGTNSLWMERAQRRKQSFHPSFYLDRLATAAIVIPGSSQQPLKIYQPHSGANLYRFSFDKYRALYEPRLLTRFDWLGRYPAGPTSKGLHHSRPFHVSSFDGIS
jgi:hypothetical protein